MSLFEPLKYVGWYHHSSRRYRPYWFGSESYQHVPDRGPERWEHIEPFSYRGGNASNQRCGNEPGPECVGAYCHNPSAQWVCPPTELNPQAKTCKKVLHPQQGHWYWQCGQLE